MTRPVPVLAPSPHLVPEEARPAVVQIHGLVGRPFLLHLEDGSKVGDGLGVVHAET